VIVYLLNFVVFYWPSISLQAVLHFKNRRRSGFKVH